MLVFWCPKTWQNSNAVTPNRGAKWRWGRFKWHFRPVSRNISETVQDREIWLLWNTDRTCVCSIDWCYFRWPWV